MNETSVHSITNSVTFYYWQLKICVTLVITACLEVEHGIDNLWSTVAQGFKVASDYGQFVPQKYFNAFICGFPHPSICGFWRTCHGTVSSPLLKRLIRSDGLCSRQYIC
jgi:hypothetical protein